MKKRLILLSLVLTPFIAIMYNYFIQHEQSNEIQISFDSFTPSVQKQVRCLAENIYYESAYEPDVGKVAIAFVTMNRTKSQHFPSSICDVVTQKTHTTCQFSWYCQEKQKKMFLSNALHERRDNVYENILSIASFVYVNYERISDPTNGALFYHADYVNPRWKNVEHTTTIGRHIFYIKKDREI
jgi:spore germination cell wall hydrolase CwlJ-like protein